jgi:hypothetical protein
LVSLPFSSPQKIGCVDGIAPPFPTYPRSGLTVTTADHRSFISDELSGSALLFKLHASCWDKNPQGAGGLKSVIN